jgi:hypothetical protein
MPATIVGQNGATITRTSPVLVTGCGLKILRARVKKKVATLTIQVPKSGRLTAKGKGLKTAKRSVETAPRNITLKVRLSKAGKRALARRHRLHAKKRRVLKVRVTVRSGRLVARRTLKFR